MLVLWWNLVEDGLNEVTLMRRLRYRYKYECRSLGLGGGKRGVKYRAPTVSEVKCGTLLWS